MGLKTQYLDERFVATAVKHAPLPFFHSCEAVHLQSILDGKALQPRPCKVYGEDLLYLFYGKPAYKSADTTSSKFNFMMPLCFMINNDAVTDIRRIAPFDTGAFSMYESFIHKTMKRDEFHLTPQKESLIKVVDYFYGDNDAYFKGKPKEKIDYDPVHFQIEGYHSLITTTHRSEVDDRKSSFEVQLDKPVPLNNTAIDAIILPTMLAESPAVKHILVDTLGINLIPIINYGVPGDNYYVEIMKLVKEHMIAKKLLNGH